MGTRRELFFLCVLKLVSKMNGPEKKNGQSEHKESHKKNPDGRSVSRKNPVGMLIFVTKGACLFLQAVLFFRPTFSAIGLSLW